MNIFKIAVVSIVSALLVACAGGTKMNKAGVSDEQKAMNQKAYDHYFNGVLLDFQDQYDRALIEYYQALLYDSTSAQILKSISRNLIRLQYYEGAVKTLEKSYQYNPKDQETLNYLGEVHYNLQNYQKSISYYHQLLDLDPYNVSVQNNLIFLYSQLKMDEDLRRFYKKMMAYYPDDSNFAIQYALASIRQKEIEEARLVLENIIQKDSTEMDALTVLGNLYEIRKDTVNAIRIYRQILRADPLNDDVLNRLYRIYRDREQWEEMEGLYRSILAQSPSNSQVRLMLAETHYFQEEKTQAREVIEPVLHDQQYQSAAFELLGRMAFEDRNLAEAESYFLSLTQANPANRFGWLFLAVIYNQENKYDHTVRLLQSALNIHPQDPDLLALYGSTLSQVGRDEEALYPLQKSLQLDQENMATVSSIAAVYDKLHQWEKSDSLYTIALEKDPENALLLNNYSYSLAQRDLQLEKALEMVDRALLIDPDNGAYLDTKGWIMYKLGNYQEALYFIQRALDSREESAEVLEHMGDVYFKLEQFDKAKEFWEKALVKDPSNTTLAQKIQSL